MSRIRPTVSIVALVLANLLPLLGIFLLGWDTGVIVFLYWTENIIVGSLSILKIAFLKADSPKGHVSKLLVIPFFCLHYGGFCAGHGLFLRSFFDFPANIELLLPRFEGIQTVFLPSLAGSLASGLASASPGVIGWTVIALVASHGVSFLLNFVWRGEYRMLSIQRAMFAPYPRMAALHVALVAGGIAISMMGSPTFLLAVLVLAKIGLDLFFHVKEHDPRSRATA